MRYISAATLVAVSLLLTACANDTSVGKFRVGQPYSIAGKTYYPQENYTKEQTGIASWYGPGFDGKKTANGERFDQDAYTAAHPTLQMPSLVRVTNLENGRSLVVRVNDRGPFHSNRVMDVSKGAAKALGMIASGTARVRLQVLGPESMALAQAAKQGIDTKGAEIAMNNEGRLDERFAAFYPSYVTAPQPGVMVAAAGYQPAAPEGAQVALANTVSVPQPYIAYPPQQTIVVDDAAQAANAIAPITSGTPQPDVAQEVAEDIPAQAPMPTQKVAQLPSAHKTAIFQMAPIAEANAAEMPQPANAGNLPGIPAVALGEEAPVTVPVKTPVAVRMAAGAQPNYLPAQPKFMGMRPVVDK